MYQEQIELYKMKLEILKMKANTHVWQVYTPKETRLELEAMLIEIDKALKPFEKEKDE